MCIDRGGLVAVLKLQSVVAGVCRILNCSNGPGHALAHTDSKCTSRGWIEVDLHVCSPKLLYLSRQTYLVKMLKGMERVESQTFYSVTETFLLMCHKMARPPESALPTNPVKKTPRQGNTNNILLISSFFVWVALFHPCHFL